MIRHGLRQWAEDHTHFGQFVLEGGRHRHTVEYRIDRDAGERLLLFQRNPQLVVGFQQLWIHFVQAFRSVLIALRR